jgi:hypothetical protein
MEVAWASPGAFTTHNFACYEDGSNCVDTHHYEDPSKDTMKIQARLEADKGKVKAKATSTKSKTGIRG